MRVGEEVVFLEDGEDGGERSGIEEDRALGEKVAEVFSMLAALYPGRIDLGLGRGEDRMWTNDLSEEYVRLNSKYTT